MTATSRLNLRAGPGIEHPVSGALSEGEPVTVLGWDPNLQTIGGRTGRWARVRRENGHMGWVFGAFLTSDAVSPSPGPPKAAAPASPNSEPSPEDAPVSHILEVNTDILPRLLAARGYTPADTFKAIVIEIVHDADGSYTYYPMDYKGTSLDRDNWWPASTVKIYAATAALEMLHALGFDPLKTEITYDYEDEPVTQSFEEILRRAITDSKNAEFDRLVDLVGSRRLNRYFLVPEKGILNTVMLRCYSGRTPNPETGHCSNRVSPSLTIRSGDKQKTLPVRTNTDELICENEGNCTTLRDLTEVNRRVMMHETLPKKERYRLGEKELALLRSAMSTNVKGGVADGIRFIFKGRKIELFHKGGYADHWITDNMFVRLTDTGEQWIIGMTDRPGREALNEVTKIIAGLIADHTLTRAREQAFAQRTALAQAQ